MIEASRSARGRVPAAIRSEILIVAERAHDAGASYRDVSDALGIDVKALMRWRWRDQKPKLVAVRVPLSAAATSTVTLHGPRGLRIDGVSLDDVAALWMKLS